MLQLVKLALSKPYTFIVLAILILLSGGIAWETTPTDIFPDIRIPVIAAVWTYNGLPPEDMAGRVVYYYERQLSATVNDIARTVARNDYCFSSLILAIVSSAPFRMQRTTGNTP